jgi:subtilase family serine protease
MPTPSRPKGVRLRVEPLEARDLLSVFTPAQIRQAYGFDKVSYNGSGQTIAIVDAFDDPKAAADLATFSSAFGLPPANFTKATPQGLPAGNAGWAGEIALDVEWAHAIAPGASILLVEARTSSLSDLLGAVDYARRQPGVTAVSLSWGASEFAGEQSFDSSFTTPAGHPGVTFVAAAGDNGSSAGPDWPASSPNVVAVGGTVLTLTSGGAYGGETGWTSGGGGTSAFEPEPAFQKGVQSTGRRQSPDVAYHAGTSAGFDVYLSYGTSPGWYSESGTSAGAPQWAALVALANQARAQAGKPALDGPTQTLPALYAMPGANFHDVTSGNNGSAAKSGYDLVTGRGSPVAPGVIQALLAFSPSPWTRVARSFLLSPAPLPSVGQASSPVPPPRTGEDACPTAQQHAWGEVSGPPPANRAWREVVRAGILHDGTEPGSGDLSGD